MMSSDVGTAACWARRYTRDLCAPFLPAPFYLNVRAAYRLRNHELAKVRLGLSLVESDGPEIETRVFQPRDVIAGKHLSTSTREVRF